MPITRSDPTTAALARATPRRRERTLPGATEIRRNANGSLDEVVAWGCVHLEQMDTGHWVLIVDTMDGQFVRVTFSSQRAIKGSAEVDGPSDLAVPIAAGVRTALARNRRRIARNRRRLGL